MSKDSITVDGVVYYQHPDTQIKQKLVKAVEELEWLKDKIRQMQEDALNFHENMKEEGLTANTIESEGYLRAAKYINNEMKFIEESVNENVY